jgi:YfiR/HmsC-like
MTTRFTGAATFSTRRLAVALIGAIALFAAAAGSSRAADAATPSALKAAFLFNFAKFADWSGVQPGVTLVLCVANDDQIGAALADSVRGQAINGHALEVRRLNSDNSLSECHLLFVPASDARLMLAKINKGAEPMLTVSDAPGFAQSGGMIELFQESGRMRFAVNVDTAQRAGVRLSSRLLDLAKIVRTDHGK